MNDKLIDTIAQMWASHPEAATLSLHWLTVEQQLESEGDERAVVLARTIRGRAAQDMKMKALA